MATNDSYIASGFRKDCEKLINRFEQLDNVRFQDFCEIWKDMKFSLIFTCRQTFMELVEFCEEAMHISKQFLLPPYRFKGRVGGLYLVYGLYYKMPINNVKIRVKLIDWQSILELHTCIKEGEHLDANYVLTKLIVDNAFMHCAFDREYGLEKYLRIKERHWANHYSVLPAIKDMAEQGQLLARIDSLSKLYHKKKCAVSNGTKPERGLELFEAQFSEKFINEIQNFECETQSSRNTNVTGYDKYLNLIGSKTGNSKVPQTQYMSDKAKVRAKVGHGFDTDSSDEESLTLTPMEGYNHNLPETFEDSSDDSD